MTKKFKKFEFANLGLFLGKYELNFTDKITVITGNNGTGKSTIISGLNATLGKDIDNAESLISNGEIATNLKLTFDDDTSVMLKLLKERNNDIRKMYFINHKYTNQEQVKEYVESLSLTLSDNFGVTLSSEELTKTVQDLKTVNKQIILATICNEVLTVADKIINVEELKQCQIV